MEKLYRFFAPTADKAMLMAHNHLGSEAFIFSTRDAGSGIEIIAGVVDRNLKIESCPVNEIKVEDRSIHEMLNQLMEKLQETNDKVAHLSDCIHSLVQDIYCRKSMKKPWKYRLLDHFDRAHRMMIGVKYGKKFF